LALVLGALPRHPVLTLDACRLRLRGKKVRARHYLAVASGTTPLSDYPRWAAARAMRLAAPEPAPAVAIGFAIAPGDASRAEVEATRAHLAEAGAAAIRVGGREPGDWTGCAWVGLLRAGDRLAEGALDCLAAAIGRDPGLAILFSDEDEPAPAGGGRVPWLKPDWSPRLQAARPPRDGLALLRADLLRDGDPEASLAQTLARPDARVGHVRRILLHRGAPAPASRPASAVAQSAPTPSVSVVIPNKDRLGLLRVCLEGLIRGTDHPALDIFLVDNGSEEAETHAFYRSLAGEPRLAILERPGPFNYSALTNAGVAASTGELLLLLNNDIEIVRPDWLALMVAEATRPGVGAVGATLLYPDRRIQHAGVAIGLGGEAGHLYRGRPAGHPDAFRRLDVPHEVSAVTGACLLVSRSAYDRVGGLDEAELPVSFNDIDLCLKLRQEGLRNILVPDAVLIHHESASRGRDTGAKEARARREAAVFASRWRGVMRDDPYFHPGLSLLRFDVSLG
ncbi:MAG: glycosyltransferase family 2 protein, partial [Methylobacteriaceae bacterium]|nr:glycosyltransferase family 2 protein [Methylobacteriaceae bacterium]